MTAYQFSQPWLSKLQGDQASSAMEWAHLRDYLKGIDNGTVPLFNLNALNATITNLTIAGAFPYLPLAGGTMSGAIAMGSNKITGLAAASANGDAVRFEQLKFFQLVSNTSTSSSATTSTSYADTNLSITITPSSASNRILIIACSDMQISTSAVAYNFFATIANGSTNLSAANGVATKTALVTVGLRDPATLVSVDSPASTSAQTYKVRIKVEDASVTGIWGGGGGTQWMVACEVG